MSKRPTDHLEPAAKKRGSERQLTKDDDEEEHEVGFCERWRLEGVYSENQFEP
jgi:hypothetical protein